MVKETLSEFRESLNKLNDKNDDIIELIHKIDTDLSKINHDLYGNGRAGLFEEFKSFKETEFKNFKETEFNNLKKSVQKNAKVITGGLAIISFLYFVPTLKEVIKMLIN